MPKLVPIVVVIVVIALGLMWFSGQDKKASEVDSDTATSTAEELKTTLPDDGSYEMSADESTVNWRGTKTLIENYEDTGTLKIKSGVFAVESGIVSSGTIVFDMSSLEAASSSNSVAGIGNLTKHLKSADFLDTVKFPTATFVLVKADPVGGSDGGTFIFTGNLTLKGIAKEIQFPVHFAQNEAGEVVINGEFEINRTNWDIRYGSTKFFQGLGDKAISDMIQVKFEAVAKAV